MSTIIQTNDLRFAYPAVEGATPVVLDGGSAGTGRNPWLAWTNKHVHGHLQVR